MSDTKHVLYEVDEGIAVITLDRPQAANRIAPAQHGSADGDP